MIGAYQNFFWNTFWGIFADRSSLHYYGFFTGPTGFDSETNGIVSMLSAGVQLINIILHTFNWRKQLRSCRLI